MQYALPVPRRLRRRQRTVLTSLVTGAVIAVGDLVAAGSAGGINLAELVPVEVISGEHLVVGAHKNGRVLIAVEHPGHAVIGASRNNFHKLC